MPKKKEPPREWSLTQSWHRLPRSSVGIGLYPFFCLLTLLPVTDTRGSISRLGFFFVRKKSSHNRPPLSSFVRPMVYQLSCANFSQRETDLHLKSHTHTHTNLVGHKRKKMKIDENLEGKSKKLGLNLSRSSQSRRLYSLQYPL